MFIGLTCGCLGSVYCGRGDRKTAKGKRFAHSFGNVSFLGFTSLVQMDFAVCYSFSPVINGGDYVMLINYDIFDDDFLGNQTSGSGLFSNVINDFKIDEWCRQGLGIRRREEDHQGCQRRPLRERKIGVTKIDKIEMRLICPYLSILVCFHDISVLNSSLAFELVDQPVGNDPFQI